MSKIEDRSLIKFQKQRIPQTMISEDWRKRPCFIKKSSFWRRGAFPKGDERVLGREIGSHHTRQPSYRISRGNESVRIHSPPSAEEKRFHFSPPDRFEIARPFSGHRLHRVYNFCLSKPASPGFKFSKLDDWPFRNLLTNSEDGSTIQLLCGKFRSN